jgi:hypothetical protein
MVHLSAQLDAACEEIVDEFPEQFRGIFQAVKSPGKEKSRQPKLPAFEGLTIIP